MEVSSKEKITIIHISLFLFQLFLKVEAPDGKLLVNPLGPIWEKNILTEILN